MIIDTAVLDITVTDNNKTVNTNVLDIKATDNNKTVNTNDDVMIIITIIFIKIITMRIIILI